MRVLARDGYRGTTMSAIAREAQASKETLYAWFGDLEHLMDRLIRHNADRAALSIKAALAHDDFSEADARSTLINFAEALLTLVTSNASIAINRAAMTSPNLARTLRESGPQRVRELTAPYFGLLRKAGLSLAMTDNDAFSVFYGVVVRDTQVATLLGEPPPNPSAIRVQAEQGVDQFLALVS